MESSVLIFDWGFQKTSLQSFGRRMKIKKKKHPTTIISRAHVYKICERGTCENTEAIKDVPVGLKRTC
jgi:hypothetical protein